jgi:hypothetical protein
MLEYVFMRAQEKKVGVLMSFEGLPWATLEE